MADEEDLQSMILKFRVNELTALLSFAGRNKQGRKNELQARCLDLLKLNSYPVCHKIRELYQTYQASLLGLEEGDNNIENIENINNAMQQPGRGGYLPAYPTQQQMNTRSAAHMYAAANAYYQHQTQVKQAVQLHPSNYPIHPDVKFKKLPFYEVSAELIKPSSLVPQGTQRQQDNQFVFHLTPQQATAIGMSRDMRPGSKVEYAVQVQLRFCLLETTSEQEDCFPPGVVVKVNGKMCQLPNPIPTNKPGVEPKRPPRPVNITPLVKISPTVSNSIHVQWSTDYTRGYVLAVYLVHKKTSDDLLNRLKAKGIRGADYTRGMIKDKLNEDADSEIATTSLRVSLICPLGKMRMTFPCRASTCMHLQCFDAGLYLQMNERKPTWVCPVCDRPAVYDKLVIDGYFQEVLSSGRLLNDGNEIQLNSDGSWSSLTVKKEKEKKNIEPEVPKPKVEMFDIEPEAAPAPLIAAATSSNSETAKKKEVVVDLTLSDSDDEPLSTKKTVTPDSSLQNVVKFPNNVSAPNSVSSSGQHSPSLIILDSDSPPSTPTPTNPAVQVSPRSYSTASTASCHSYLYPQAQLLDLESEPTYRHIIEEKTSSVEVQNSLEDCTSKKSSEDMEVKCAKQILQT